MSSNIEKRFKNIVLYIIVLLCPSLNLFSQNNLLSYIDSIAAIEESYNAPLNAYYRVDSLFGELKKNTISPLEHNAINNHLKFFKFFLSETELYNINSNKELYSLNYFDPSETILSTEDSILLTARYEYMEGKKYMWFDSDKSLSHLYKARRYFKKTNQNFINNDILLSIAIAAGGKGTLESRNNAISALDTLFNRKKISSFIRVQAEYQYGVLYQELGLDELSLKHNLNAERLNEKIHHFGDKAMANLQSNIARTYFRVGEYLMSEYYNNQCIAYFEKTNNYTGLGGALMTNAQLAAKEEDYGQAIRINSKALAYNERVGDNTRVISCINNIASCYTNWDVLDSALIYHERALRIKKHYHGEISEDVAISLNSIGNVHRKSGDLKSAKESYDKSKAIFVKLGILKGTQIGALYRDMALLSTLKANFNHSMSLLDTALICASMGSSKPQDFASIISRDFYLKVLINQAQLSYKAWNSTQLDIYLTSANSIIATADAFLYEYVEQAFSRESRLNILTQMRVLYDIGIELKIANLNSIKDIYKAFYYSERTKSLLLKVQAAQYQAEFELNSINDVDNKRIITLAINDLQKQLSKSKSQTQRDSLELAYIQMSKKLKSYKSKIFHRNDLGVISSQSNNIEIIAIKNIQNILNKEVVLHYHKLDSMLITFIISRDTILFKKVDTDIWESDLELYLSHLNTPPSTSARISLEWQKVSNKLFNLLVPIELIDTSIESLIIIPDKNIGMLPFSCLLVSLSENIESNKLDYLLKYFSIRQEYSSYFLTNLMQIKNDFEKEYVAFAPFAYRGIKDSSNIAEDPRTRSRANFTQLPFTKEEVNTIQKYLGGEVYLDTSATRRNFMEHGLNSRLLHLSTHAFADNENSFLNSGFALFNEAGNKADYFSTYEIQALNAHSELAILSACESGIGTLEEGEGIMSLSRALKYAGIPNTIMSLWKVNDFSTKELITKLYANLENHIGKAEALRLAQLEFVEEMNAWNNDLTHPYYWSGIMLVGNNTPLGESSSVFSISPNYAMILFLAFLIIILFRKKISKI